MKKKTMMKLTKNFSLKEFTHSVFYNEEQQQMVLESFDKDSELKNNIQKLANNLQVLRNYIGKPIKINIGFRPLWWELKQGRSGKSQHVFGKAADISINGVEPLEVYRAIELLISRGDMLQGGLGLYNSWVHYDIRKTKARWDKRK